MNGKSMGKPGFLQEKNIEKEFLAMGKSMGNRSHDLEVVSLPICRICVKYGRRSESMKIGCNAAFNATKKLLGDGGKPPTLTLGMVHCYFWITMGLPHGTPLLAYGMCDIYNQLSGLDAHPSTGVTPCM